MGNSVGDMTAKKRIDGEMTKMSVKRPVRAQHPVTRLSDMVACLRSELKKDLPIQHLALLLAVVEEPGISMPELMKRLKMPQGSVSRNVKLLADRVRGYGLLLTAPDQVNRKQMAVYPTWKCQSLVEKLCRLMQHELGGCEIRL